jgi:hypothetical protein
MRIVRPWSAMARVILANTPRRVRRELVSQLVVELVHRLHQADVPFLHQVEQVQTRIGIVLCDAEHESQIGPDEFILGPRHLHLVFVNEIYDLA